MIDKIQNVWLRRLALISFCLLLPILSVWICFLALLDLFKEIRLGFRELWHERIP